MAACMSSSLSCIHEPNASCSWNASRTKGSRLFGAKITYGNHIFPCALLAHRPWRKFPLPGLCAFKDSAELKHTHTHSQQKINKHLVHWSALVRMQCICAPDGRRCLRTTRHDTHFLRWAFVWIFFFILRYAYFPPLHVTHGVQSSGCTDTEWYLCGATVMTFLQPCWTLFRLFLGGNGFVCSSLSVGREENQHRTEEIILHQVDCHY